MEGSPPSHKLQGYGKIATYRAWWTEAVKKVPRVPPKKRLISRSTYGSGKKVL